MALLTALLVLLLAACESPVAPSEDATMPAEEVEAVQTEEAQILKAIEEAGAGKRGSLHVIRKLIALRIVTARYHRVKAVKAAGYELVPGLDHCFSNEPVGAMGYHYIDTAALDLNLDPLHPEAIVYAPRRNGSLRLAAVEYIVPADAWDASGATEPPVVLGRHLHLNAALGVYVLHAWIWMYNPSGLFEDWNPRVTCP